MGRPTTVGSPGKRLLPAIVSISLFLPLLFSGTAPAADVTFSSKTYGLFYQRELAGGVKDRYAPLYEYLSADAANLGGKPLSFHFYGWGRADLAEESGSGRTSGEIGSLYMEYLHPQGNAQAKLGRFFLTEGVAMDTIDGAFAKATSPVGLGVSLYGGVPVEYTILNGAEEGDSLYGGRVFFVKAGFTELGASYLKENGSPGRLDRELYGGDLWVRVASGVELTGQASYNRTAREMASERYAVRIVPGAAVDISAGYEAYTYEGLFRSALNPAFVFPTVDNNDQVRTIFGIVDWEFIPGWTLEVAGKNIRHDKSDPGDANRGEVGLRYSYNAKKDVAGIVAAFVAADRDENEYREYRAFATHSPDKLRLTLDAIAQQYKREPIAGIGKKNAYQVVASAGYQLLAALQLSGDLTYTQSPIFEKDYAGLVRLSYDLGTGTGGKK
ncbi:hypothetical protein [Candidatus Deferrimicrobium sp.]|jgi:hypothetical protein|uniref:hypothetical protein n=1 Tax=Candidatus Deferrimicrobium sp. TaxID=3060586 RepID=UPI002EDA0EA1